MGALRLLLALSVVLTHTGGLFRMKFAGGVPAVELFFMISGFFMAMILSGKYDPVRDRGLFYGNRALRIFVPYYAVLAVSVVIAAVAWIVAGAGPIAYIQAAHLGVGDLIFVAATQLTIVGQEAFLFLTTSGGHLTLSGGPVDLAIVKVTPIPPAWSISLELIFYAFAPFLLRLRTRWIVLLALASFGLRIGFWSAGLRDDPWSYRFLPLEAVFFLLGVIAYRIAPLLKLPNWAAWGTGLGFLGWVAILQPASAILADHGVPRELPLWLTYIAALVVLPVLFRLTSGNMHDKFLANFSYPVYLVHWPMITLFDALWPGVGPNLKSVIIIPAAMLVAFAITEGIEKPLDVYRQRRMTRLNAMADDDEPLAERAAA